MQKKPTLILKMLLIMVYDAISILIAGGLALLVRFDFSFDSIPETYLNGWFKFLPLQIGVTIVLFFLLHMYHFVWRNVSAHDVFYMVLCTAFAFTQVTVASVYLGDKQPKSVIFIQFVFELILLVGGRCVLRFWEAVKQLMRRSHGDFDQRILVVGAGEAGRILARELLMSSQLNAKLCCVVDDNESKWGKYLESAPIIGGRDVIPAAVRNEGITQIIVAIPSATPQQRSEILNICNMTGVRTRTLPGVYQFVNGETSLSNVRDVQVEDLLGRTPVHLNTEVIDRFLRGKTVLVTGGGGSIGSELCRQIAMRSPKSLIIVDIYENNAYDIQQELRRTYGDKLDLNVVIASVRDKARIYDIFEHYRPDLVFHAAAHKHVPLMEESPAEAIKNNIFGTYHVVRAAEKFGVKKFVMISTDKAVNPTNVMGATKRFCEMVLQSRFDSPTEYCAVRFGNVLGSNGSVVPLFKRQIEEGGPVTVTDKRIIRYFMTIPEAAQLVLEAGAMAKQSQIFVLDMGEPVRILDLAEKLIRLSGYEPYRDIEIREVGLRPGEKLYEELLMSSETLIKTDNEKIFVEQQQRIDPEQIMVDLTELDRAVTDEIPDAQLISTLRGMIPTYHAPEEVNRAAEKKMKEHEASGEAAPAPAMA
ncbi:MAG: polysaccharide biosynthesis protein [Oscillospiraceae bacterium]|nr:polysaccharide biosynthesis protein [Oscillospiraceae bacterium]